MKLNFDDLKKLKEGPAQEKEPPPGQPVLAIVRVREPGYVPKAIKVRSRVDDEMFTAEFPYERLAALRADKRIASVELSRPLKQID